MKRALSSKAAQRAYVNFGSKSGVLAEFDPKAPVGGKPIIILHSTNGGQSTARHLSIQVHTSAAANPFSFTHRHRFRNRFGVLSQGGGAEEADLAAQAERIVYVAKAQLLWSPEELKTTDSSKRLFLIEGELAYCDIFGVYHCQPFAAQYLPEIDKFGPWPFISRCAIEPGHETVWLNGTPIEDKEIEACEQPNEPEYFEFPASLIATPTMTPPANE